MTTIKRVMDTLKSGSSEKTIGERKMITVRQALDSLRSKDASESEVRAAMERQKDLQIKKNSSNPLSQKEKDELKQLTSKLDGPWSEAALRVYRKKHGMDTGSIGATTISGIVDNLRGKHTAKDNARWTIWIDGRCVDQTLFDDVAKQLYKNACARYISGGKLVELKNPTGAVVQSWIAPVK